MDHNPPDDAWTRSTCKIGQGTLCCRYITMSEWGWSCEKHTSLKEVIDRKVADGQFNARGDNCEGKGARLRPQ